MIKPLTITLVIVTILSYVVPVLMSVVNLATQIGPRY
jgi:hypothetical protein